MNLQDPDGIVHQLDGGLADGNEAFQMLLDSGFNVNVASKCHPNLTVAKMVDAAVTCISCLAVEGLRKCFICSKRHHGACDVETLTG